MNEVEPEIAEADAFASLKARADQLERQLQEAEAHSAAQVRAAELKAEAVRAGIVDLDGLRLLDPATLAADVGASDIVARLRLDKPWLFGAATTSSAASPPAAARPRQKRATEMSVEEWRAARAELLRRRT